MILKVMETAVIVSVPAKGGSKSKLDKDVSDVNVITSTDLDLPIGLSFLSANALTNSKFSIRSKLPPVW
jgi:hypothetical protein